MEEDDDFSAVVSLSEEACLEADEPSSLVADFAEGEGEGEGEDVATTSLPAPESTEDTALISSFLSPERITSSFVPPPPP